MAVTRFEGTGPVGRYWLANCEGFSVRGGARGVVEELIRDADPHVTTRFVVRTRVRRRRIVSAGAVAAVVPAERLLVVARPRTRRRPRKRLQLPSVARLARRAVRAVAAVRAPAQSTAAPAAAAVGRASKSAALAAGRRLAALARVAETLARPAAAVLSGSFGRLATEVCVSGTMLLRSARRWYSPTPRVPRGPRTRTRGDE
jgi:hypothetical protein